MTDQPLRLTPTMVSRKLQALDFITRYIGRWGGSPSYDEIANELGVSKTRARTLVRQLTRDGHIVRERGAHRAIALAEGSDRASVAAALQQLRRRGFVVDEDLFTVSAPCTNPPLPELPPLQHIPGTETGDGNEQTQTRERSATAHRQTRRDPATSARSA